MAYNGNGWRCTCPYHARGNRRRCKHIRAVENAVVQRRRIKDRVAKRLEISPVGVECRFCHKTNFKRWGSRRGADGSLRPRFKCLEKDCRRRFTHNPGFIGKHHAPAVITDALDRYAGGMCAEAIVQNMRKNGIPVSERTLRRWFVEYRDLLERYIGSLTVQAGHTWHADEIQHRARNDDRWMSAMMDRETRFILVYEMSSTKFGFDATNLFKTCIGRAAELPDTLITDGLAGFARGHKGAMFKHGHPMVQHIGDVAICDRHASRHVYERLNGDIRMAIKRSRGFNSDNPALFGLWIVCHNFIKRHSGLGGAVPAEAAGITVLADDKWLALIQNAALAS